MGTMASQFCFVMVTLLLCVNSVAGKDRIVDAVPLEGQISHYSHGTRVISTEPAPGLVVSFLVAPNNKRTAWITLVVENASEQHVDVIPTNVRARHGERIVKVYSPEEVMKKEKRRQAWEAFGAGLAMAGNAYNAAQAGHYNTYGTYSGSYSGTGAGGFNSGNYRGTYSGSGYDPYAATLARQQATEQNMQLAAALKLQQSQRSAGLEQRLLHAQTVAPGEVYAGDVLIDLPRRDRRAPLQRVVITLAIGETHAEFAFEIAE